MRKLTFLLLISLLLSCGTDKKEQIITEPTELSISELQNKSIDELRIIRNEIFARKGYIFNSQDLLKHFSTFDWYEPKYENVDSLLSDLDKKNIQTVLELENRKKSELELKIIRINETEFEKYKTAYDSSDSREQKFIDQLFQTIDQFKSRPADTTILTIGNVDDIGKLDTISSRIYLKNDTIYVKSEWSRNGTLLWNELYENPYLWINDNKAFDWEERSLWVTFTIAIYYGTPELHEKNDFSGIDRVTALKMAKWDIENNKLKISDSEYITYFDSFNGQLFQHGEPEIRNQLLLWYEPLKTFVLYYSP